MIEIDGSHGEGGGQIIRTALALSAITKKSFRIKDIRKNRDNPGLAMQHLYCVKAMQKLCDAHVDGAQVGSMTLEFYPRELKPQTLSIDIETAGSITLLLQSLLPACILSGGRCKINAKGGTDVRWSMPFDYTANVLIPHLRRYADFEVSLLKRGYYPKGGGEVEIKIKPRFSMETKGLGPKISLLDKGDLQVIKGVSHSSLDLEKAEVAERQAKTAAFFISKTNCPVQIKTEYVNSLSPGSGITLWAVYSKDDTDFMNPIVLGADALGERGKRSEDVGKEAAEKILEEISLDAPVDEWLADNLIPYLAIFGGQMKVTKISEHTKTNIKICEMFLGKIFEVDEEKRIIKVVSNQISSEKTPSE